MRLILAVSLALAGAALAAEITFEPHQNDNNDATIRQEDPDHPYGDDWTLYVGHSSGHVDFLIQFFELDDYLDVDLVSATLKLYCTYFGGEPPSMQARVCRIAQEWNEADVTWNTSPGYDSRIGVTFVITDNNRWYHVDVTGIVQSWIDGDMAHYGFYVRNTISYPDLARFVSGDYYLDYTISPKLTIVYTVPEVEEASWGEIKAGS